MAPMQLLIAGRAFGVIAISAAFAASPARGQGIEPPPIEAGRVPPRGAYQPGFDALHYAIEIRIPETGGAIDARARIAVAVTEPRHDQLWLDLSGLRVDGVRIGVGSGAAQPAAHVLLDGRVRVPVPGATRVGDTLNIDIEYGGVPDDGLILRENVHGQRAAFADNWPDRARFWFPSIDHPSDKATVEFVVHAPTGWEVIANGARPGVATLSEQPADGVWRWKIDVPIPTYTMVIGGTDFAIGSVAPCAQGGRSPLRPDGCVPVSYWVFPEDSAKGAAIFRRAGQMIDYYSAAFGPFPYHKLAHVQSATRFGGMENAGAIFYSEQAIAAGSLGEGTVAHETAHQWFGDAVTEADWSHLWLSEGFATYFGMQFFEHADGASRFREMLLDSRQGYLQSNDTDIAMVDTTAVPENNLFALLNSNSYNKGGQVLHMLRGVLGDSAFFAGVRAYYLRYSNRTALTRDLQHVFEETSGTRLDWFFDQWAYHPGHPVYRVAHTWDAAASEIVVTVEQVQKADWPAFRMPIDFAFTLPQGVVRRRADVAGRLAILRFRLPAAPSAVRFDPDDRVLKEMAPDSGVQNLR